MSVYSGFATRAEEAQYSNLTKKLIKVLVSALSKDLDTADKPFLATVLDVYKKMSQLDHRKHLSPHLSSQFSEFASLCAQLLKPRPSPFRNPPLPTLDRPLQTIKEFKRSSLSCSKRTKRLSRTEKKGKTLKQRLKSSNTYYEALVNRGLQKSQFIEKDDYENYDGGMFYSHLP